MLFTFKTGARSVIGENFACKQTDLPKNRKLHFYGWLVGWLVGSSNTA